mgnify:CR=1 FL=1
MIFGQKLPKSEHIQVENKQNKLKLGRVRVRDRENDKRRWRVEGKGSHFFGV